MRSLVCCLAFVLAAPAFGAASSASTAGFTLSTPSRIPGLTLQPGAYTIHVVNRLSDRAILSVDSAAGDLHSTFLGIQDSQLTRPSHPGPVRWSNPVDGASYLRGWSFPGTSTVVEFVYPKAEAVAIASSNPARVPAIDPASEGKVTDTTLSAHDMQLLTLWLLSLEQVGPADAAPAIKAVRYQMTASVSQKPVIPTLPHTASRLPWIWMLGLLSLLAAAILRIFERHHHATSPLMTRQRSGGL